MKQKLRAIIVDDMPFWWKVDWFYHTADDSRILQVRIWGGEKWCRPLFANLTSKRVEYPVFQAYPMPKDISAIITYALAHGWNPSERGEVYWLKEESDRLELDDLLLTDVGRVYHRPVSRK